MWDVDAHLHPFDALVRCISDIDGTLRDEAAGVAMAVDTVAVALPVEVWVEVAGDGAVVLRGAPPTQHVETTWMPTLHQLRLEVRAA
jgi:hypothetical protein